MDPAQQLTFATRKVQTGLQLREAAFVPGTLNAEARTVDVVFTTGHTGRRFDWFSGSEWLEGLEVSERAVRLGRLNAGAPVLNAHRSYDVNDVLGVVVRAWIAGGKGMATLRFDESEEGQKLFQKVQSGTIRNVSVGYAVYRYEDVTERDDKVRTLIARDWEPAEISFVPIGFDPGAQVRSSAPATVDTEIITRALPGIHQRSQALDPNTNPQEAPAGGAENQAAEADKARAATDAAAKRAADAAVKAERERLSEVTRLCRAHKIDDKTTDELLASGKSLDETRAAILEKLASRSAEAPIEGHSPRIEAGDRDEVKTRREGITAAILHRFRPGSYELPEHARQFRGMTLVRLAEEVLIRAGRNVSGYGRAELAQRALATSDFPIALADVARKTLSDGYKVAPKTFQAWTSSGTLPDYKEMSVVKFGAIGSLSQVDEDGEYTETTFGEGEEKIKVLKYGKIVSVTEELIINDDLRLLARLPFMFGNAAARLESKLVYDVLLNNAAMSDSVALFHASHGNLAGSGGAISGTTVGAGKAAMRKQKDLDSQDYLDLAPKFLICGPDKEVEALQLLAGIVAATTSNVNVFANSMTPVIESRITGNQWYLAADPAQIDTVEVSYLEGMSGPEITSKEHFESDGMKLKIKHVVGAKALDHRGLYKNAGA